MTNSWEQFVFVIQEKVSFGLQVSKQNVGIS